VQTSGGGVDPQTQALSITVNKATTPPPSTPDFTLTTDKSALTFTKPKTGDPAVTQTVVATVARSGGFTGAVNVSLAPTATGITAAPITIAAGATTGNLIVSVADTAAVVTSQAFNVSATATGVTGAKTKPLAITVSAAAPVLTSIAIANPATFTAGGSKLNVGAPATFTTTGKDQNGNPFTPTTPITWTSSNASIVSIVSGTGVATAQQISTTPVTLTATSGAVNATVTVQGVYSFAASIGTQTGAANGSAYMVKIQNPNGVKLAVNSPSDKITVNGPTAFNGGAGKVDIVGTEFTWDASNDFGLLRAPPGTAPTSLVTGAYTMTTTVGSDTYTTASFAFDAAQAPLQSPTNVAFAPAPQPAGTQNTTVSWTAVPGALSYRVVVLKGAALNFVTFVDVNVATADVSFAGATTESFSFLVIAYNTDITSNNPTLPAQLKVSSTQSSDYLIP
jgi:hypothetical protein